MTESYIKVEMIVKKPETEVYNIKNKNSGDILGIVKWYSSWRQYCFFPKHSTIFNKDCMNEIIDFINTLMEKKEVNNIE